MKVPQWIRRWGPDQWRSWPEKAYRQGLYRQRLQSVQQHLTECLDSAPSGSVRIISMCAGDGRDVIGVLKSHRRRTDAAAWLVELNGRSVSAGVRHRADAGLEDTVNIVNADATAYATYQGIAPADIVLVCGVWGHVPTHERATLVRGIASLCKPGGKVIWTRGVANGRTRFEEIESHFAGSSWEKVRVSTTADNIWAVATHRYRGPRNELPERGHMFHFQARAGK